MSPFDSFATVRTQARFPEVPESAGHYESFYLKLTAPEGGRSAWIRHTVHKRPDQAPTASLWFTWFDADAAGPVAVKQTFAGTDLDGPAHSYIRIGTTVLSPERAVGAAEARGTNVRWDLSFTDPSPPFHHLPRAFLYKAPLPRTKLLSPYPNATFAGRVEVGGQKINVDGWRGMMGHNWGAEHAERWTWIQGTCFEGRDPGDYFDLGAGRIKIAGRTTPWIANANLRLGGKDYRLGGVERIRSTEVREAADGCEFELKGRDIELRGKASAPVKDFVAWIYADPVGPEHETLNCSIADLELGVRLHQGPEQKLVVTRGAAYELGTRDFVHGVPVQPYADG